MAFTLISTDTKRLTRGIPATLGTFSAVNQAVQFSISPVSESASRRFVVIAVSGLTGTNTALLEASLDGGTSWFVIPALASDVTVTGTADTAASISGRYEVSGLAGSQLRFGLSAYGAGTGAITALID